MKSPIPEVIAYPSQSYVVEKEELYEKLHDSLKRFGFILRFKKGKQNKTGYPKKDGTLDMLAKSMLKT